MSATSTGTGLAVSGWRASPRGVDDSRTDTSRRAELADVDPGMVRASDAERDTVAMRLSRAHLDGRLDRAEFTDRVAAALHARTRGDLDILTGDLPPEPAALMQRPGVPGVSRSSPVTDSVTASGLERLNPRGPVRVRWGPWVVVGSAVWMMAVGHPGRTGLFWPAVLICWGLTRCRRPGRRRHHR